MIDEEQEARADKHHQPQHYRSEVELLDIEIEPEIQQQLEEIRSKPLKKKKDKKDSFKLKLPQKKSSSLFCKCFMCSKAKRESKKKEGKPKELEEVKAESEQVEAVPVKQQKEAVAINVDLFKGLDRAPNQQPLKEIDYRGFIDVEPIKKEKKKKSTTTTKEEGNASPNLITTTPTTLPEVTENTTTLPKQTEPILETPILDQNLEILKEELEKVKTEEEKDKGAHVVLNTRKEPPIVFPGEQQKQQQNTTVRVKEEFKEVNEGAAKKLEEGARIILDTIKETPILFTSDLEPEAKTSVSAVPEKEHFEATVTVEKKPEEEAIGTQPKKKGFSLASCFHCGACASRKKTKKIKSEKNAKEHKPAFIDNTIDLPCIQTPDNPILNKEDEIVSKKKKDKKQKPEPMPPKKPPRGQLIETTNFEQVTPVIATPSTVQVQIEEKEGDRIVLDTRKEPPIVFPGEHQQKTTHIAISSNKEEDEEISRKLAEGAHIVLETKKEPPIVFPGERVGEFKIEIKQEEIKVATESSQVQEKAPVITVVETTKDKKRKKAEEKQKHHEERRKKNVQEEEEKRKRKEQEEEQKRLKKELEDEEKRNREEEKRIKEEQEEEEKRKGKEKEKEDEKSLKKEAQESEAKAKQKTEEGTRVVLNTVKEPPIVFPGEQKETTTTTVAAPISPVSKKQKEKEEGDRTVLNTVKEPPIVFTSETTKTATICPLEAPVSLSKKKEDTEKLAERAHIVLDTKKEPAIVFTSDLEGKKEVEFPSYYIAEIVTHKGDTTAATTEEKKKSSKEKLPKTTTTTTTTATLSSITSTLKKESEDDQMATDINKVKQLNVEDAKLLNKNRKRCVTYLKQKSDYDENKCSNKEEKRSLKLATKLYGKCIKYTLKNNRTKKQKDRLTYDQIKHKLSKKSYTFGRTEHITRCVQQFQIDLETGQLLEQLKEKKDDKKEQRRKKSSVDETSSWSINQIFNRHKQKKSKKLEEQAAATANQAEEEEQPVIRRYPSLTWREANERARILFYKGRVPSIHYNEKRDSFRVSMITQIKSKTDGKERPQEVPVFDEDVRRLLNASGLYWDGESISLLNKSEEIFNQVQRDAFDFLQLINANKESVNITEQDYLKAELTNGSDEQQQQRQSKLSYTY